jgi:DNA-binding GntR family transcriptional regulator
VDRAAQALDVIAALSKEGPAQRLPAESTPHLDAAQKALREAEQAVAAKDTPGFRAAMTRFREAYAPVREWTAENKRQR